MLLVTRDAAKNNSWRAQLQQETVEYAICACARHCHNCSSTTTRRSVPQHMAMPPLLLLLLLLQTRPPLRMKAATTVCFHCLLSTSDGSSPALTAGLDHFDVGRGKRSERVKRQARTCLVFNSVASVHKAFTRLRQAQTSRVKYC